MLPQLEIEAPPELAAVRTRLQAIPSGRFNDIAEFLGIDEAGPAIRVILAPENSELARSVVSWISGFAIGESSLVVMFPARSPGYPDNTLEDVLRHEVAHVLIWRATAGRPLPRWFNEGLAMEVERERRFQDQTQLLYQLLTGGQIDLERLDRLFSGTQNNQTRAYALSGAFVHDLLQRHGSSACKEILIRVRRGTSFDDAVETVTGNTPSHEESEFWRRQRIWTSWVPIVTSSTVLWLAITMLAILAIYIRRRRNKKMEEEWEKEESDLEE
jgi:hypothetical protein